MFPLCWETFIRFCYTMFISGFRLIRAFKKGKLNA